MQYHLFFSLVFFVESLVFFCFTGYTGTQGRDPANDKRTVCSLQSEDDYYMRKDDIIKLSIHIITEYYKNNLAPFFACISDDVLWIGPARKQQIRGRKNLMQTFASEKHDLTFTMGDIKVICISPSHRVKEVLLHYDIYTHYPSGGTDAHDQCLHYTWCDKKVQTADGPKYQPQIVSLHISNAWPYDDRDVIYPVHSEHMFAAMRVPAESEQYITVKAADGCVHRLAFSHILYVDTLKHTARLQIHTESGTLAIHGTLSGFEANYPALFVRIHSGYLLNPAHVTNIRRFAVTLSDGTQLPVPEKRYTQIKRLLLAENC